MPGTPSRRLVVEFTKMTGAGNDFVVVDNRFYHFSEAELAEMARRYCPRRTGIGADGILALESDPAPDIHYRMRYVNADGSRGTMCGNGARCLARYARNAGFAHPILRFATDAGPYTARVPESPTDPVRLHLPAPSGYSTLGADAGADLPGGGHFIWTGTEHLVVFVADVDEVPVASVGPRLRHSDRLPDGGANVDFVQVDGNGDLRVRTYEKGVEGETLACGTGAVASAIVACITGQAGPGALSVHMRGGTLEVGVEGDPLDPESLWLEGPADVVFRGSFEW